MKKSNLFIALLSVAALTSLAGCNGNTSSPSISSGSTQTSANPDSITSVVINGPKTVNVGQTVTLVAGVTGDDFTIQGRQRIVYRVLPQSLIEIYVSGLSHLGGL